MLRQIEKYILEQWLETGSAPSWQELIEKFNVPADEAIREQLRQDLVMDEEGDGLRLCSVCHQYECQAPATKCWRCSEQEIIDTL